MRIVIVEDEWESREGLVTVLRSIDASLTIASAANAEDGFALLAEQTPDLVFLDIRMPDMDGLTMLEQIRRRFGDIYVVILSAYDHFPYAQRAIRLGVFDYIVKPYSVDIIRRIVEYVAKQNPHRAAPVPAQHIHLSSTLVRWLQDPDRYASALQEQLQLDEGSSRGTLIVFRPILTCEEQRNFNGHARASMTSDIRRALEQWFNDYGISLTFSTDEEIVAALLYAPGEAPLSPERIAAFLGGLLQNLLLQTGITLTAAIGETVPNLLTGVQRLYHQLAAQSEYAFYAPKLTPLFRGMLHIDVQRTIDPDRLKGIELAIREGDPAQAVQALFADLMAPPWMPPQRLIYSLHSFMTNLLTRVAGSMPVSALDAFQDRLHELSEYPVSITAFADRFAQICVDMADVMEAFHLNKSVSIMSRCIEYLNENYGDNSMTQETVAQKYHFSPSYFGTLFKATTGQTFVQYLNTLRIDRAREMLESSNKKVYEVAERAGFSDVRYFIRVFKKMTGISPNQYRAMSATGEQ